MRQIPRALLQGATLGVLLLCGLLAQPVAAASPDGVATMVGVLPTVRSGTSAVWDGTNAYIFGGQADTMAQYDEYSSGYAFLPDIVRYNPATDTVTTMNAVLPSGRAYTSAIWDGTNAYIFGGTHNGMYVDEIVRYHPGTDTVTTMTAKLPTARTGTSAIWDGTNAYIFGSAGDYSERSPQNIVRYNPASDSVTVTTATLPATGGYQPGKTSAIWDGSNAYVFNIQEIYRYNPATNTVTTVGASLPAGPLATSAIWDGTNAYILGGEGEPVLYPDIVRFTPTTNSVATLGAELPSGRSHTSAVWDGQHVYIFGGDAANEMNEGVKLRDIVQFHPAGSAATSTNPTATTAPGTTGASSAANHGTNDASASSTNHGSSAGSSGSSSDSGSRGAPVSGIVPLFVGLLTAGYATRRGRHQ